MIQPSDKGTTLFIIGAIFASNFFLNTRPGQKVEEDAYLTTALV